MRRARAATILSITSLLAVSGSAFAAEPVQPGAYHVTGDSGCTLNFIYDGAGGPYVGTAAHCVERVGDTSYDADGDPIGRVAAIGNEDATATDWALIRVEGDALGRINPSVIGHPGTPTGVTTPNTTATGDRVFTSGHGLGFGFTNVTREQRPAALSYDDTEIYQLASALIYGDSGGPVVHAPSGRALGIVSRLCIGPCEEEGPTVQGIIAKAAAQGLSVALRPA
jgi:hypothetical protein